MSPSERAAALDDLCAGSPELRAEVESFLAADAAADRFLEEPLGEVATTLLREAPEPAGVGPSLAGHRLGPYKVIREIGAGGMGVVYEGLDTRLDRRVALKLLPSKWSRDAVAKERFVREARAAAALDHPNICNVHDVGESDDGQLFIVMAFYDGETLQRRIGRGRLPPGEARDLAVQVARGLEHAHAAGIVHRDVKPSNVMLLEARETAPDRAKILDFGIARVAGADGPTGAGRAPGTPAYMSPEQASGLPVDERTDIWSLGVMLYEMLAGHRPFRGEHPQAAIHSILYRDPDPLDPEVPADLARVVDRALAKEPTERYQRMADLLADLEQRAWVAPRRRPKLWAAALVASLAGLGVWWASQLAVPPPRPAPSEPTPTAAEVAVPVVGVVPFVNRTGEAKLDWYGEGVARLVADALAPSRHLQVVSALRIEPLLGAETPADLARRATEGGIGFLVTGEILPAGQGLILAVRLVATADGRQLASVKVDVSESPGLFEAADDAAREVRKGLGVPTTETVDVFAADFASDNPDAYELYLRGLTAFASYRYDEAEEAFNAAIDKAPGFVMARYRLAHVLAVTSRTEEALATIRKVVAEVDRLPDRDARYVRALEAYISHRYVDAAAAYRQILDLYPYEAEAAQSLARLLYASKRYEDVLEVTELLARIEPGNHIVWSQSGSAHLALGDLHRAALDFERYIALEPDSANAHHLLGDVYRAQEELDLAATEYSTALTIDPTFHFATIALAIVDVFRGRPDAAESRLVALVSDLDATPRHRIGAAFELSFLYRAQGRFRSAATVLEELEELIAGERVREAMALSVRGACWMELGNDEAARRLIDLAVERSPGAPSRYLFARGLFELHRGQYTAVEKTAEQILREAQPEDDSDRTAQKAAAYLRGLRWLMMDAIDDATAELTRAVTLDGYKYVDYRLGLARAYLAAGRLREAMAASRQVANTTDLAEPRLDLELGRVRALLVLARVQEALGRPAESADHAREFLSRWSRADPGLPELDEARRLAVRP